MRNFSILISAQLRRGGGERQSYTPIHTSNGSGREDGIVSLQQRSTASSSPSYVLSPETGGKDNGSSSSVGGSGNNRAVHTVVRLHRSGSVEITTSSPPQQQQQQQQHVPQHVQQVGLDSSVQVLNQDEDGEKEDKVKKVIERDRSEFIAPLPTVSAILSSLKR